MPHCKICGDERNAIYRERSGMTLCPSCYRETPAKVGRLEFDRDYWGAKFETVPDSTRRDFYDDYRASTHGSVLSYHLATSEVS